VEALSGSEDEVTPVEVFAAQKRAMSDMSVADVVPPRPAKQVNTRVAPVVQKKKRTPPRRLPVVLPSRNVWDELGGIKIGLSVAEWLAIDKNAYKQVRDGLRFLHGRKPAVNPVNTVDVSDGSCGPLPIGVNKVDSSDKSNRFVMRTMDDRGNIRADLKSLDSVDATVGDVSDADLDDEDSWFTDSDAAVDSDEDDVGYLSDDTEYHYPYDLDKMRKSKPFFAPVMIGSICVKAIFDSGAGVSVIGSELAERLGLVPIGDSLTLTSYDRKARDDCPITVSVPIRVAGKYRPEHMCIKKEGQKDLCLLGMTWFTTYGIKQDLERRVIIIPTKNNTQSVELYDDYLDDDSVHGGGTAVTSAVFAVNVRSQELEDYNQVVPDDAEEEYEVPMELENIVSNFEHCFVENVGLGRVRGAAHSIPLEGGAPIRSKPYRLTWEEEAHMREEIATMLELGLIRPSNGLWTSPVFFVKKRGGALRMVIDYRRLNDMTLKDAFPLPHIDDLLDSFGGARVFSTLDAASGFYQIPMSGESIEKTGFVTKTGTYEFVTMPFGLTSAPSTFQRVMTNLLRDYIGDFVCVFIDDVIVFSQNMDDHCRHLSMVFAACNDANLRLKKSKCKFGQSKVEYLGHVVCADGLLPCTRNVDKLLQMRQPRTVKEVRSFLGTAGYYRRFIADFAAISKPLTKLLKKGEDFNWNPECTKSVNRLKLALTTPPLLSYPNQDFVQVLTSDASGRGLGAILSQYHPDDPSAETVIAYASRTLRGPELNYAATHLEALGVVWAVSHFRHFVAGRHFKLRTDHSALVFIFNKTAASPKVMRWCAMLMEYDFQIVYKRGKDNPADALSRL
jgi:hypothetical protein